ncbi:MAG TPA: hypothetical protein VMH33_06385 [Solirubrobacterales bacterium]|nr:hypothetical protein [Solirubrobacterales bacterium]
MPDTPGWVVRVVPNKYPAIPGQEVVVHGPDHVLSLADLPLPVMDAAIDAWARRIAHHEEAGAAWVMACVNEGAGAGASLPHSHSQIIPLPELPPLIELETAAIAGDCPLCDPAALGPQVSAGDGLHTLCPPWSRMPYETWIVPAAHARAPDRGPLAEALLDAVGRLRRVLGDDLAWNAVLHGAPAGAGRFHWHVEISPRLTVPASLELGTGLWVNVVDPELAAAELREA